MASVSYNGQSFLIDGRKVWILGASLQYARIEPAEWPARIAAAREAGFNTIETAVPWLLHEPKKGRYVFEGDAGIAQFLRCCADAGMRVLLRAGPFVGAGFDGGGLPAWLVADPAVVVRERNDAFLDRVGRWFRKLMNEIGDLQVTKNGPILAMQLEHAWACANDEGATAYLGEIGRLLRESGASVPLYVANNLWCDPVGTIDSWQGSDDLLANLRQLRLVQPDAPRLVSAFDPAAVAVWGRPAGTPMAPATAMRRFAEILAAGGQPVVSPFHGGTNFGFLGGSLAGPEGGTVTTSAAVGAPLGEAGGTGDTWRLLRRVATFADEFQHLFADLDPEYQPVALDTAGFDPATKGGRGGANIGLVPLRGGGGKVVFAFSDRIGGAATLLMQNGIRLPIDLGDQPVGWFVTDVDLQGRARLDYANLCPEMLVDRRIVVFQGPAKQAAVLSVNGTPIESEVPSGRRPAIIEHKGLTFVLCSQKQFDVARAHAGELWVGVTGFDADGKPIGAAGWAKAYRIAADGRVTSVRTVADPVAAAEARRGAKSARLDGWEEVSAEEYANGASARYASLPGPQDLSACGATSGYGWYRIAIPVKTTKTRTLVATNLADRAHLYLDGELATILGDGTGAEPGPISLKLAKGERVLGVLVESAGRYADGNESGRSVGFGGDLLELKSLSARPKTIEAAPIDPFKLRAFIAGGARGLGSDAHQLEWSFSHLKKSAIVVVCSNAPSGGTFALNDEPIAYFPGTTGSGRCTILLDPADPNFRRGKNVLRFAPDPGNRDRLKDLAKAITLHEVASVLTADATWSFAKWEPPARYKPADLDSRVRRGVPVWWKATFETPDPSLPLWLDVSGLSKGVAFVNGRPLGRYFTQTRTGANVGPQGRLYVPAARLNADGNNELVLFDEHGFVPTRVRLALAARGDLD